MTNWRKAMEVFNMHVDGVASAHNDARTQLEAFQNQRQSVSHLLQAQGRGMEVAYRTRLMTTLDVTRFLLKQGLPFRGHEESLSSSNKGNFLELIEWYTQRNDEVAKTMNENAPGNNQMKSPTVQKDLTRACVAEVTNVILNDIKDNIFSLMVDECRDILIKEQMGVVLRYVNKHGCVIERFLAIVHVSDTSAISLKKTIDELFAKHKLSLSRLRGQGYDGASNMRGEYNGLKALILKENSFARYAHCFAHQLQLVVVAVAKSNRIVSDFFQYVTMIVNITVFENVYDDDTNDDNSGIATSLIDKMESYEFMFVMHLMKSLLGITNELSHALQQKDQNIVLAVSLIKTMKDRLQKLREEGWENFLDVVNKLCSNHMIPVPNMEENMRTRGRSRRNGQMITNFHHYRVEIFCQVLDTMVQEMNNRFLESSTEVLTCIACLDPKDSFSQFDISKLLHLAELFPKDFSLTDRVILEDQLETYIQNVRVATASVERVFSAMKIIKTDLRNRMGDEWMNDSLVVYIEKDIFAIIENEQILQHFQQMNTHRIQLSPFVVLKWHHQVIAASTIPNMKLCDAGTGRAKTASSPHSASLLNYIRSPSMASVTPLASA
ncbi:zinc finger MYM-type protein 1-like [Zingiber officinale]|uniref:zinc finger MYM-type protein 1-like n=1 Tax=Zingiber officinale TaxID=94328 RepID=UPI001C4BA508|nr:zinc finger MYM-type protein 1-like [Zingiber officinale]